MNLCNKDLEASVNTYTFNYAALIFPKLGVTSASHSSRAMHKVPPTVQFSFLFNAMSKSLDDASIWARGHRPCSKLLPDLSGSTAMMTSNRIDCFDTESKKCPLLAPCIIYSKRKLSHEP